jgi:hypothetical protein
MHSQQRYIVRLQASYMSSATSAEGAATEGSEATGAAEERASLRSGARPFKDNAKADEQSIRTAKPNICGAI